SKSEPEGFWPQRKQEVKTVARFWALLGILGLTGYGASFLKNERSPDLSRYLKLAALKLQKEKILWQLRFARHPCSDWPTCWHSACPRTMRSPT
ncbi:unnamed protein product, partial [Effrenium voratum]